MTFAGRTLVLDNRDSFTFNLVHVLEALGDDPVVVRSDAIDPAEVLASLPRRILVSPGPGRPEGAGRSLEVIATCHRRLPILGVCLGHQCLGALFGMRTQRGVRAVHGRVSEIRHDGRGLFASLPNPFRAARYHSLVLDAATLPEDLVASAWTRDDGQDVLMGIRHASLRLEGVQFHPESFLTEEGAAMLRGFLAW
jgi:anthranilate synthase component 2